MSGRGYGEDWSDWPGNAPAVDVLERADLERLDPIVIGVHSIDELGRDASGAVPDDLVITISFPDGRTETAYKDGAWRGLYDGSTFARSQRRLTIALVRKTGWYKTPTLGVYLGSDEIEYGYGTEPAGFPGA